MDFSGEVVDVQFARLQVAAQTLTAKAGALNTNMSNLVAALGPLKQTWYASGSTAGEAAHQSEQRLRAAVDQIILVINQFSSKVTNAHDTQVAMENTNASYFA